jgi:hypothetical protein
MERLLRIFEMQKVGVRGVIMIFFYEEFQSTAMQY